jgi:hypothetical protein
VNLLLGGETLGEGGGALVVGGGDGGKPVADGGVRVLLKVAASLDANGVLLEGLLSLSGGGDGLGEGGDLSALLGGEGEPVGDLGLKLGLGSEGDGGVEEGRGGSDNDTLSAEGLDYRLGGLERSGEVVLPDVATRDESEGEGELGGLNGSDDRVELSGSAVEVDVKGVDGELGDVLDVLLEAAEVGGQGDLEAGGGLGESLVGPGELLRKLVGGIENESGLVNLNLGRAGGLELLEELTKDGGKLVEDVDGLEGSVGLITASLADEEVGDGSEKNGAGHDAGLLGLNELVDWLGVDELEVGVGGDLALEVYCR